MADPFKTSTENHADWAAGDFAVIGSGALMTAELLAEALDVRAGWTMLDVAAGHGNMTLAGARRGCRVTSTDFIPALLERGKARADAEGWRIDFLEADAQNLPFADGSFDLVTSTFGVIFAPDQAKAAAEMMRVCRKGGRIGLANWTPDSFVSQLFATIARYVPPPAGTLAPALWGTEPRLRELFAGAAGMQIVERTTRLRGRTDVDMMTAFRKFFGPIHRTFAALDEERQAAFAADLLTLTQGRNCSGDSTVLLPSEYLEVVITR